MSDKSELYETLNSGIDFKRRRIYWGGYIDSQDDEADDFRWFTVEQVIRAMRTMFDLGSGPIELHMSSVGGDPYDMLRLVDEIEAAPVQIIFYGGGKVMSSATWIMAVCDLRYLHKNTAVLIHDGTEDLGEKALTDLKIDLDFSKDMMDRLYRMYSNNSLMPINFWREVCQRDLILSAEETVKLGLADEVIEPRKRGNLRKVRMANLKKNLDKPELEKLVDRLYRRVKRTTTPLVTVHMPKEQIDPTLGGEVEKFTEKLDPGS
jgi:ATP-dependent protease ClpP protease subunit